MSHDVLTVESLVAGYGDLDILRGVNAVVRAGEVVSIIGPNGAGKSTLLKAILGLGRIRSGRVRLGNQPVTGWPTHRLVAAGIGYVPQLSNVFPNLTVDENLDVGAHLKPSGSREARRRVQALFPLLAERAGEKVGRLSGGQRQMVALGRALMLDPKVLLLDEPSAGLAPNLQEEVFQTVKRVAEAGTAVLLVEQNAKRALATCDRAYVLDQGLNRFEGRGADLLADPRVGQLYLGRA